MKAKQFPRVLLVGALVVVVGMAFRVSWNALRDVARAIGADPVAALLYGIVVDGLMALALVATLVLVGNDRRFALRVLGAYTAASLVLNYVHGLVGQSADWGRLAAWDPANWALVLLATSLPVGSIYFGSDLVAKVLHHQPEPPPNTEESAQTRVNESMADLQETPPTPVAPSSDPMPLPAPAAASQEPTEASVSALPGARVVAAESTSGPQRATGRLPQSARPKRPTRSAEELLADARSATKALPDAKLTAEVIRKSVHCSAANARDLRDRLKAKRAEGRAAEQRHLMEAPEVEAAFARLAPGLPAERGALGVAA